MPWMETELLRLEFISHSWSLMPREAQVSSLPTNHFPAQEKHFGSILLSKCHLSQSCRDSLGFSTPGIKSLMIEYLSLGKLFLARAVWNQFIVYRGKHLKKGHSSHHCESRALRFIHIKDTMTAFHSTGKVTSMGTHLFPYLIFS